jgi:predicted solute-binding protein
MDDINQKIVDMVSLCWEKLTHLPIKTLMTAVASVLVKRLTELLLNKSAEYAEAHEAKAKERSKQKMLIKLAPSHDYVQCLLDDLLSRQRIWIDEGRSEFEVLYRTLGWVLFDFLKPLGQMTWDNVWSTGKEKGQNKEG